ncbi:MAG: phosphopeptide-binding protein [Bacteroidota bacterium]
MRYYSLFSLLLLALLTTACGNRNEAMDNVEENANKLDPVELADDPGTVTMSRNGITLTSMPDAAEFPNASLDDWTYQDGQFSYTASNYDFGQQTPDASSIMCANSGKGQHAHLIVNNDPYIAKYDPEFELELPDGTHHILTFLSRSYHLSIKNGKAHRAVKAEVKDNSFASTENITGPMLFYSRPKGSYKGKQNTENILLDFYPINAELGAGGYTVKVVVNGSTEFMLDTWQPYFLQGLPMGENTVELTLMKDGAMVEAPLNPVKRTFTLEALPTESK